MQTQKPTSGLTLVLFVILMVLVALYVNMRHEQMDRKQRVTVEEAKRKETARLARQEEQRLRAAAWEAGAEQRRIDNERERLQREQQERREETARHIGTLTTMAQRFSDQHQIASSTPRIALAPQVQQMQLTARQTAALPVTGCMQVAKAHLVAGMNEVVLAYLAFMRQENTSPASSSAAFRLEAYRTQMDACAKVAQ